MATTATAGAVPRLLDSSVSIPRHRAIPVVLTPIDGRVFLVALIWGSNFAIINVALRELPPLGFNALRLIIASAVLLSLLGARRKPLPPRDTWLRLTRLGLIGHCVYQVCFVQGVARTSVPNSSLIMTPHPAE